MESKFDEPEHKARTRTLELRPSVSQAHRSDDRYVPFNITLIPPKAEQTVAEARAISNTYDILWCLPYMVRLRGDNFSGFPNFCRVVFH